MCTGGKFLFGVGSDIFNYFRPYTAIFTFHFVYDSKTDVSGTTLNSVISFQILQVRPSEWYYIQQCDKFQILKVFLSNLQLYRSEWYYILNSLISVFSNVLFDLSCILENQSMASRLDLSWFTRSSFLQSALMRSKIVFVTAYKSTISVLFLVIFYSVSNVQDLQKYDIIKFAHDILLHVKWKDVIIDVFWSL